jgi:hypothetical protein
MSRRYAGLGVFVACLVLVLGCGGKGKPVKVQGVVTLDGKPVPGATVVFVPEEGSGRPASGRTEADGTFRLTTYRTDDGALPGQYKVTVNVSHGDKATEGGNPMQMDEKAKMAFFSKLKSRENQAAKKPDSEIPAVYQSAKTTPLKQIVPPEGAVELSLRSSAR